MRPLARDPATKHLLHHPDSKHLIRCGAGAVTCESCADATRESYTVDFGGASIPAIACEDNGAFAATGTLGSYCLKQISRCQWMYVECPSASLSITPCNDTTGVILAIVLTKVGTSFLLAVGLTAFNGTVSWTSPAITARVTVFFGQLDDIENCNESFTIDGNFIGDVDQSADVAPNATLPGGCGGDLSDCGVKPPVDPEEPFPTHKCRVRWNAFDECLGAGWVITPEFIYLSTQGETDWVDAPTRPGTCRKRRYTVVDSNPDGTCPALNTLTPPDEPDPCDCSACEDGDYDCSDCSALPGTLYMTAGAFTGACASANGTRQVDKVAGPTDCDWNDGGSPTPTSLACASGSFNWSVVWILPNDSGAIFTKVGGGPCGTYTFDAGASSSFCNPDVPTLIVFA